MAALLPPPLQNVAAARSAHAHTKSMGLGSPSTVGLECSLQEIFPCLRICSSRFGLLPILGRAQTPHSLKEEVGTHGRETTF